MPAYVIADNSACLDAVIIVLFIIWPKILTVIKVNLFERGVHAGHHHPYFSCVPVQKAQHSLAKAFGERALIEIMAECQYTKVSHKRIRNL